MNTTQNNNNTPATETIVGYIEAVVPKTTASGSPRTDYLVRREDGTQTWINAAGEGNIAEADYPAGTRIRVRVIHNVCDHPTYGHRVFSNAYERPMKITANGTPVPDVPGADLSPDKPAGHLLALGVEALRGLVERMAEIEAAVRKIADAIPTLPPNDLFDDGDMEGAR